MFISKLRSKVATKKIDSFEDLYINQKKIIIKGNHFVDDFFTHSGSEAVKRVKGDYISNILYIYIKYHHI